MLSADGVQKIVDIAKFEVKEIGGRQFHVGSSGARALDYPERETLNVFGLSQVLNFIKCSAVNDAFINVLSETRVQLIGTALDKNQELDIIVDVDFSKVYKSFPFEKQLSQEEFIIELQTKFEADAMRAKLMTLVSKIKAEKVRASSDTGFSQVAQTRSGVSLASEEEIPNLWELFTYKSFPEIKSPLIPYVLRLHQRDSEMPKFALYECDGGAWKVKATREVRDYCAKWLADNAVTGVAVL